MVLNGFLPDFEKQCMELNYFKEQFAARMEPASAIVICRRGEEELIDLKQIPAPGIVLIPCEYYQPEAILKILTRQMNKEDLYLFGHSYGANEIAVRAAARLNGSSAAGVHKIEKIEAGMMIERMVYSNYMMATFLLKKSPYCIAIANGLGEHKVEITYPRNVRIAEKAEIPDFLISRDLHHEVRKATLAEAQRLIVAGRGAGNKEQVQELEQLSQKIHGKLGVSRPVAMNAWAPMEALVGVSGTMTKPKLCITVGVSGAAAFYLGIEKSEFIVAINKDKNAPIIKKADVAIIEDFSNVIHALSEYIEKG